MATAVHNALLCAVEDGLHTADVAGQHTTRVVGTRAYGAAVIERLGWRPQKLAPVDYVAGVTSGRKAVDAPTFQVPESPLLPTPKKSFDGIDVFVDYDPSTGRDPQAPGQVAQGKKLLTFFLCCLLTMRQAACGTEFTLQMISNRGVVVWPNGHPDTYKADHWRCRFKAEGAVKTETAIPDLLHYLANQNLDVIKTKNLYSFGDSGPGCSAGQGQ